jgi:hypothetical protein
LQCTAAAVLDGEIFLAGGWHGYKALRALLRYSPKSSSWIAQPDAACARNRPAVVVVEVPV